MKPKLIVPSEYKAPSYVAAFMMTALLLLLFGVVLLVWALYESSPIAVSLAVSSFIAAAVNYLYGQIANDIGRTAWQTALLAQDLRPAIEELEAQAKARGESRKANPSESSATLSAPTRSPVSDAQRDVKEEEADEYWVRIKDKEIGPIQKLELIERFIQGQITLDTEVAQSSGGERKYRALSSEIPTLKKGT